MVSPHSHATVYSVTVATGVVVMTFMIGSSRFALLR